MAPATNLRQRLIHFLTAVFPEDVALAATLNPVPAQGTIFPLGRGNFGLKALELQGKIPTKVVLSRELDEAFCAGALTTGPTFCTYRPGEEGLTVVGKMKRGDHEIWLYAPPRSALDGQTHPSPSARPKRHTRRGSSWAWGFWSGR